MPTLLHQNASAPSPARLRYERVASGVVAEYIREISRSPHPVSDAAARPARPARPARTHGGTGASGARLRAGARRRSHAPGALRPLTAQAGRQASR